MIPPIGGLATVTVPAEVGRNDGKILRESRGDLMPHHVGLRIPMQEQHGCPFPACDDVDRGAWRLDSHAFEALEHSSSSYSSLAICTRSTNMSTSLQKIKAAISPRVRVREALMLLAQAASGCDRLVA